MLRNDDSGAFFISKSGSARFYTEYLRHVKAPYKIIRKVYINPVGVEYLRQGNALFI